MSMVAVTFFQVNLLNHFGRTVFVGVPQPLTEKLTMD